jgi:hypothetical protein
VYARIARLHVGAANGQKPAHEHGWFEERSTKLRISGHYAWRIIQNSWTIKCRVTTEFSRQDQLRFCMPAFFYAS